MYLDSCISVELQVFVAQFHDTRTGSPSLEDGSCAPGLFTIAIPQTKVWNVKMKLNSNS